MTHIDASNRLIDLDKVLEALETEGDAVVLQEEGKDIAVILLPEDYAYLRSQANL
ncbi:MAG: hypothetical protein WC655_13720 [Candidatus Hydrogenedentales bacterium]|jgi:hypothetical protein